MLPNRLIPAISIIPNGRPGTKEIDRPGCVLSIEEDAVVRLTPKRNSLIQSGPNVVRS